MSIDIYQRIFEYDSLPDYFSQNPNNLLDIKNIKVQLRDVENVIYDTEMMFYILRETGPTSICIRNDFLSNNNLFHSLSSKYHVLKDYNDLSNLNKIPIIYKNVNSPLQFEKSLIRTVEISDRNKTPPPADFFISNRKY